MIAILPPSPIVGSYCGVQVEPLLKTVQSEEWGPIYFYRKMKKKERLALKKGLTKAHKLLDKLGLWRNVPEFYLEIKVAKGKYAGYFKKDKTGPHITFKPKEFEDAKTLSSLIYHEWGHVLEMYMPNHIKVRWIKAYHKYLKWQTAKEKALVQLRKQLEKEESLKDFRSDLVEEDIEVLDEVLSFIESKHGLDKKAVALLVETGQPLSEYWPTVDMIVTEWSEPLGEYATKNYHEFWAEAFMSYMSGLILPKSISSLMVKTLSSLARKL